MDDLVAQVVKDLSRSELEPMLRLASLYLEAGWMSETEWRAWRRAILARLDIPTVSARLQ